MTLMLGRRAASFILFFLSHSERGRFAAGNRRSSGCIDDHPALKSGILIELQVADALADFNVGTVAF